MRCAPFCYASACVFGAVSGHDDYILITGPRARGRVDAAPAIHRRAHENKMTVSKPPLVFLLANYFSGATLLTILLAGHRQIVSNGEAMYFDDTDEDRYDCTCGKYIDECGFYGDAAAHMRLPDGSGWDRQLFVHAPIFSRNRILRSFLGSWRYESALRDRFITALPDYRRVRDRFIDAQLRFFANARKLSGASIYLDGTKSVRRAQLLARDGRSDVKAIHLIRDGRGFSGSDLKNTPNQTVSMSVNEWLGYIAQVDRFSKSFPTVPLLVVRYEDLCRATEKTLRAIYQFIGIPYEPAGAGVMSDAHILGNRMRRGFSGAIVEDTSWKERLDAGTQKLLTSGMQKQLERFGYI